MTYVHSPVKWLASRQFLRQGCVGGKLPRDVVMYVDHDKMS